MVAFDRNPQDFKYLRLLSRQFPTEQSAFTEIINLSAILNLPKGTEHFMSDVHGEYEAFMHILNNCSGVVREHVDEIFGDTLSFDEKGELCTLIYYPREKIDLVRSRREDSPTWYKTMLDQLIVVARSLSSRYTRSKVRKAIPRDYAYIIDELLHTHPDENNYRVRYHERIVESILETASADDFIESLASLIKRLAVDHLHLVGDIFDRGGGAAKIMDRLLTYHSLDIQWGNHDILWMGAAVGNPACIATVIRNSIRYGNLDVIEDGYGINMIPLATFAMSVYADDDCSCFEIKNKKHSYETEIELEMKMHKAITVIQFKLEGQLIQNHPEFDMNERCLLDKIDFENGTVTIGENVYKMKDVNFPTIDKENPYKLTEREEDMMNKLYSAFVKCEKLQKHMQLMLKKGGMYKVYNGNLLFHGCVPMNSDGSFKAVNVNGKEYSGKDLYDAYEACVRKVLVSNNKKEKSIGGDILWYLWSGSGSPLFGRDRMTTFERYFIEDKTSHHEEKNAYYDLIETEDATNRIFEEFGLDGTGHIINGHVPVHQSEGENPLKCDGKVIMIDGGFSKPYHKVTGIAGYTLTYNSYGLTLTAHEPFESAEQVIQNGKDIVSNQVAVQHAFNRILVGDTDNGKKLKENIADLKELIEAYRQGIISEREK